MWPPHQIMPGIPLCFLRSAVSETRNPFALQAAKQPLHRRVAPAVAATAHALLHAIAPQPPAEYVTGILAPLIRMEQYASGPAALLVSEETLQINSTGARCRADRSARTLELVRYQERGSHFLKWQKGAPKGPFEITHRLKFSKFKVTLSCDCVPTAITQAA